MLRPVDEGCPGDVWVGGAQGVDVDPVAGAVEEPPHRMHIGIADRLEWCLLVPDKSAHSHAERLGHLRRRDGVAGQLDTPPELGFRVEQHLRDERAHIRARQLLQRPVRRQRQVQIPAAIRSAPPSALSKKYVGAVIV